MDDGSSGEEIARKLCREDGLRRMIVGGPSYIPCLGYRTWQAYEDANWRRFLNDEVERAEYERLKQKFEGPTQRAGLHNTPLQNDICSSLQDPHRLQKQARHDR